VRDGTIASQLDQVAAGFAVKEPARIMQAAESPQAGGKGECGFPMSRVYMRVSTDGDRQVFDLQHDALLAAGVDERHLFEDRVGGSRGDLFVMRCVLPGAVCLLEVGPLGRSLGTC